MNGELRILHCNNGNDVVGYVYNDTSEPMFVRIVHGHVIRNWGTTSGLGQLAEEGPLAPTVLDKLPEGTMVGLVNIIYIIPTIESNWLKKKFPQVNDK